MNLNEDPRPKGDPAADDDAEKLVLTSPDAASTMRDFALWVGVLLLLTMASYGPALRGAFLWDDDRHVTRNTSLRTLDGLRRIWLEPPLDESRRNLDHPPQYYPLTHTTYWLEYQLFGPDEQGNLNSTVFHVTNVLLHAAAATMLWFVFRRLRVPGAWLAAAVFALHPMNVESVAWITERKNVLSATFMFAAILAYLHFERIGNGAESDDDRPRQRRPEIYALALGLFLCAVLSKTVAVSMPAVMVLLLWWKRDRLRWSDLAPLAPFFVIGLAMAALTALIERTSVGASGPDWDLSLPQRIIIAGRALWFYAYKLLVPLELTFTYPRWQIDPTKLVQWIAPIAAAVTLIGLWLVRRRIGRGPVAAAFIFCGVLVPALGFFNVYPMRYSFVADHFAYHASAAFIALVVGTVVTLLRPLFAAETAGTMNESPTPYVAAGAVLLVLGLLTWRQSRIYGDEVTLWQDTVAKNPDAWMAHYNLGTALSETANVNESLGNPEAAAEQRAEAISHFAKTVELRPQHDGARNNWGQTLNRQNKYDEALQKLREAVEQNPDNLEARVNIGQALTLSGKPAEALAAYREALAECESLIPPQPARCGLIQYLIGGVLQRQGDAAGALAAYAEAARTRPDDLRVRYDYGALLATEGKDARDAAAAAEQFAQILRRNPNHIDARISLAELQILVGNLADAQMNLVEAARIDPNSSRLMEAAKRFDAAVRKFEATTRTAATQPSTTAATVPSTTPAPAPASP
jgi:tetratricopeptide (TPR) repeat protein